MECCASLLIHHAAAFAFTGKRSAQQHMATFAAVTSMDARGRKLNQNHPHHHTNHQLTKSLSCSPGCEPAAALVAAASAPASSFAAAAAAGAVVTTATHPPPAAAGGEGGVYVAANMVGCPGEGFLQPAATLTVQPAWRPDYPGAAFQPAQAARVSHVYQSNLYTPLNSFKDSAAKQRQQQGFVMGGAAEGGGGLMRSSTAPAPVGTGAVTTPVSPLTPVTPDALAPPAGVSAYSAMPRQSSMSSISSPRLHISRPCHNAAALPPPAAAATADPAVVIPGLRSMVSPSGAAAAATFSPRPSFTPNLRPSMSALPPRSPATPGAHAAAAPAVAAAALLHPHATWGSPNPVNATPLSPNCRKKSVDQVDFELQQLTHWWSTVDQLVEELHMEGMGMQEKLEELGQRQHLLQGLLEGLGSLGGAEKSPCNMTAAR